MDTYDGLVPVVAQWLLANLSCGSAQRLDQLSLTVSDLT